MKRVLSYLASFICLTTLLVGCSNREARREYEYLQAAETAGVDVNRLISLYQELIAKHPGAMEADAARVRIRVLTAEFEDEVNAARFKTMQRQAKREFEHIYEAELAGAAPRELTARYWELRKKYLGVPATTNALQRLVALQKRTSVKTESKSPK